MIRLNYKIKNDELTVYPKGEIDQSNAGIIRECIDSLIGRHELVSKLIFDLSRVTFMDSSGIGIILGRYRMMTARGGSIDVINPNSGVLKILRIAGIYSITKKGRVS